MKNMTCTFFGHRDCYDVDTENLRYTIENLISLGVETFYVGNQGYFDRIVFECLLKLKEIYPQLRIFVVLAYLPIAKSIYDPYSGYSIYPEGIEIGPPRFAIERRNKWMLEQSDYCLCCVNYSRGGAHKFALQAKRKGLTVINLGSEKI